MKNLKWLLGLPFEITARIDKEYLQFNDAKDDLKDDALKRDAFFASVHTAVALDVLQRMLPGDTPLVAVPPASCVLCVLVQCLFLAKQPQTGPLCPLTRSVPFDYCFCTGFDHKCITGLGASACLIWLGQCI